MGLSATGLLARGRPVSALRRRVTGVLYLALAAVIVGPFGAGVPAGSEARFVL